MHKQKHKNLMFLFDASLIMPYTVFQIDGKTTLTATGNKTMTKEMKTAYNYVTSNKIICEFLTRDAHKQIADDINQIPGKSTTEKGVALLLANGHDKSVQKRFAAYLAAGTAEAVTMRMEAI